MRDASESSRARRRRPPARCSPRPWRRRPRSRPRPREAPPTSPPTSAVVNATVNPRGAATTYFFQYGTTRTYGAQTPAAVGGRRHRGPAVRRGPRGLAPATTYHYRIVARNRLGVARGADRTFKTQRQPLGVTLAASPNPLYPGAFTTLSGVLSGTGNANRQIVLQSNPFPYTQGFVTRCDPHVTDANGAFAFPVLSVPVNTQFRVLMPGEPERREPDRGRRDRGGHRRAHAHPRAGRAAGSSASQASYGRRSMGARSSSRSCVAALGHDREDVRPQRPRQPLPLRQAGAPAPRRPLPGSRIRHRRSHRARPVTVYRRVRD